MLNWIEKVFGDNSVKLPEGVPPLWADQLALLFDTLEKSPDAAARPGLARDMLSWVLYGDALSVLAEIAQNQEIGEYFGISGYYSRALCIEIAPFYLHLKSVPPEVGLRWARLLDASVPTSYRYFSLTFPGGVNWPECLLLHSAGHATAGRSSIRPSGKNISVSTMERLLVAAGLEPSVLITAAFTAPTLAGNDSEHRQQMITDMPGFAEAADQHIEAIRPLFQSGTVPQRLHALLILEQVEPATVAKLVPQLCKMLVGTSKPVREKAKHAALRCGAPILVPLREVAVKGRDEQRLHALTLLETLALEMNDDALLDFVKTIARADNAPAIVAFARRWSTPVTIASKQQTYDYELPQIDWSGVMTPQLDAYLTEMWQSLNDSVSKSNQQALERRDKLLAQGYQYDVPDPQYYSDSDLHALRGYLAGDQILGIHASKEGKTSYSENWGHLAPALKKLAVQANVTPVLLWKTLMFFQSLMCGSDILEMGCQNFDAMHRTQGRPTLLELSQMMDESGYAGGNLLNNYCATWNTIAADWHNEAVWPYFAHHVHALIEKLPSTSTDDYLLKRTSVFKAIASLPVPPAPLADALFVIALGSAKTERRAAQDALANLADKETRIISALAAGKAEARAIAAQWLGRLRCAAAIPALEQALVKEKQDSPKGAMLEALQVLGQPVEKYLNRAALLDEAVKSLSKGIPRELDWFAWNALPQVRWTDSGEDVAPEVLRWLMVQAVKQKSPEPNAVLRKYCAMFEPGDRENFGQMLLESWIFEDTRPLSADGAMAQAQAMAQEMHQSMAQYPQYFTDHPHLGSSVEELTAHYLPQCLRQPAGSAIASKGLLALVAACAGARAVASTARYLKQWYGTRAAHGKALIAMLAWIEHPSATQLVLAIGSRFRTKSFQDEASKQVEALAEQRGWSVAELADRTIPSAGFDDTGSMELSYGQRQFNARLLPDFKIELFNSDGKKINALPEPRQDDDATLAKDAKNALSTAKKEVKNIVTQQCERLYEALCTERDWPFEDWQLYLNQHPVVRHLLQRLVWVQFEDGKPGTSLRPLDDGTLTDVDDNQVQLPPQARLRLAHDILLTQAEIQAWQQHLLDYQITPLFQQLGKGVYALPEDKAGADSIDDFKGHLLETFALRGRALKLGYTRGPSEDGGWFYSYQKRFPGLGLEAVIEFTGNGLPETNRTVALIALTFSAIGKDSGGHHASLSLAKVPKVLLSECYNDLRLLAAEGSGFAADWEKMSEY